MSQYKKIVSELISKNPWWAYWHDKFFQSDGSTYDYYYAVTNNCAMIIPVLDDGRLVLVSQFRYLREKISVEFPCGGMVEGELPAQTALRELQEETGMISDDLMKIGSFESLKGLVKDTAHVFLADKLQKVGEPIVSVSEPIEVLYRRVDEFEEMVRHGEIWDGQTLAAWAMSREMVQKVLINTAH